MYGCHLPYNDHHCLFLLINIFNLHSYQLHVSAFRVGVH